MSLKPPNMNEAEKKNFGASMRMPPHLHLMFEAKWCRIVKPKFG